MFLSAVVVCNWSFCESGIPDSQKDQLHTTTADKNMQLQTIKSTKLEFYHMASLKLLFLWTSILLKTHPYNFIVSKIPQKNKQFKSLQFSKVRNSAKHIMVYLQCSGYLAQYFRKLEWPLLYIHSSWHHPGYFRLAKLKSFFHCTNESGNLSTQRSESA